MKISAQCVVINEEDYVYFSLKSIYEVVDQIIIVEGADVQRHSKDAVDTGVLSPGGFSGDNTRQEINRLLDEDVDHKVLYIRQGWVDSMDELRTICYKETAPDTDYVLVADADSLFHPDDITRLIPLLEEYPYIWTVQAIELMFFMDIYHVLTVDPDKLAYCNMLESGLFWKYDPAFVMKGQRPHIKGRMQNTEKLESAIDRATDPTGWNTPINLCAPEYRLRAFHYGWVHTPEKMDQHILRWAHASIDLIKRDGGDPKLISWVAPILDCDDEDILDYYHLYHKIWTGVYDQSVGEHLEPFDGKHPPVMEQHPYFGKTAEELGWEI